MAREPIEMRHRPPDASEGANQSQESQQSEPGEPPYRRDAADEVHQVFAHV